MSGFLRQLRTSAVVLLLMTALLGLAYPLALTGVAQVIAPSSADGSLLRDGSTVVGSRLIGQSFAGDPRYFQSRPSASDYDGLASGASNLGPESKVLITAVAERRAAVAAFEDVDPAAVPPDALLASGSGLDPGISPEYAALQVPRVARERGVSTAQVRALVARYTEGRSLGFLGEPQVLVLPLNRALERLR